MKETIKKINGMMLVCTDQVPTTEEEIIAFEKITSYNEALQNVINLLKKELPEQKDKEDMINLGGGRVISRQDYREAFEDYYKKNGVIPLTYNGQIIGKVYTIDGDATRMAITTEEGKKIIESVLAQPIGISSRKVEPKKPTFPEYIIQRRSNFFYIESLEQLSKCNLTLEEWFSDMYSDWNILYNSTEPNQVTLEERDKNTNLGDGEHI